MLKIWDAPNFRRTRLRQLQAISRLARLMRHRDGRRTAGSAVYSMTRKGESQ